MPAIECASAVTGLTAQAGNNEATLSWGDPIDVAPTAYYVGVTPDPRILKVTAPATTVTVSGLRNGVEYGFTLYAATAAGISAAAGPVRTTPTNGAEGEVAGLIVAFEPGVQVVESQPEVPGEQAVSTVGLTVDSQIADGVHTVELSEAVSLGEAKQIASDLAADPQVAWAEPDQFVFTAAVEQPLVSLPSDSQYATSQWNLWDTYGVGLGEGTSAMSEFYAVDAGAGARVGVIDTGITAHPDLDGQVIPGYDFVSDPAGLAAPRTEGGPDVAFDADEQSGWDADPTDPGDWREVAPVRASSWHGTHVAGVIAAAANNAQGVTGIVPGAKIEPIRAISWRGGLMSDIAASITWASGGHVDGVPDNANPVDVINMSFAVQSTCSVALQEAIDGAAQRGTVLVAAAGNANDDVAKYAPANCNNVIAVGATGRDGMRAPYSNHGAGVDVAAPGGSGTGEGGVTSTVNLGAQGATEAGYGAKEGTSIAAAHVSAAAAYLAANDPQATAADIVQKLTGKGSVRHFAQAACDVDPAKTCGEGILDLAQIAAASEPGVNIALTVNDAPIADGSTVATNSVVGIGTSGLLSPGVGARELRTTLPSGVEYRPGTAVAPEGWTVNYSSNNGTSWSAAEPNPATGVTDVRATATVSAGAIDGTAQLYSSETTSTVPSSTFTASTGGDGWDVFFDDENVYNIFHHQNTLKLDCHLRSTGERCVGSWPASFANYTGNGHSTGWADRTSGNLYAITTNINTRRVGALCIKASATPSACGFTTLSDKTAGSDWQYTSEPAASGRRIFAVDSAVKQLLCFDAQTGTRCANSPVNLPDLVDTAGGNGGRTPFNRITEVEGRILVKTPTNMHCYTASLEVCAGFPRTINANNYWPIAEHGQPDGTGDGICFKADAGIGSNTAAQSSCIDLTGAFRTAWISPFNAYPTGNREPWWYSGSQTLGRFYWAQNSYTEITCFDYATNSHCAGFKNITFAGFLNYMVTVDPDNPRCLWFNSDHGHIRNFNAITGQGPNGELGCDSIPVITLQPSQFAPRYACSTTNGIQEWSDLRLVSWTKIGTGVPASVKLTVRTATGSVVPGWDQKTIPVTTDSSPLGSLDMSGLDPAASGSRPTFSFAFEGVPSGTVMKTAVIALDYKGKGPELCVDVTAKTATPEPGVTLTGRLTEQVGAAESFTAQRSLIIGASASLIAQATPSAPQDLAALGLNTTANVTFRAPQTDGNSPITGYQISRDGGSTWDDLAVTVADDGSLSARLIGLTVDQQYNVKVAAVNALGRGDSASVTFITEKVTMDTLVDTPLNLGPITLKESTTLTYDSTTTSTCSVTGTTVTLVAEGPCSIVARLKSDNTLSATGSFMVLPDYVVTTVPGAPTGLTARPESTQVVLSWQAPANDGGASITDYVVQYKSGSTWTTLIDSVSTDKMVTVPGLTNGTAYSFRVAAKNSEGTGAYTASVAATPATKPGAPTNLAAAGTGTTRTLTWSAPGSNGGSAITDYTVDYKLSSSASWTNFVDGVRASTGATVTGLTDGQSYDFRVATVNGIGESAFTSTVNLSATAGNEQVTLSWTQPAFTSGQVFDHYQVEYRPSTDATASWSVFDAAVGTTSRTVAGLSNGTSYDFRVATVTTASTSSYTSVASATPGTVPSAPADVAAAPGNRQVALTWSAPGNGGSAITDYVVQFKASSDSVWTTVSEPVTATTGTVVTGLPNGTSFDFRVAAKNSVGTGNYSAPINATPRTVPGTPTAVTTTAKDEAVGLSWQGPLATGGADITDYLIEYRRSTDFAWVAYADGLSDATTTTVAGLSNGTQYDFRVSAVNAAGAGVPSGVFSSRPATVPGAPTNLAASGTGTERTLTWTAPGSNGGSAITDYTVAYKLSSDATWTTFNDGVRSTVDATVTVPDAGSYDFRVAAKNGIGESAFTSTVNLTATAGNGQVNLAWDPPLAGGQVVASYEILHRASGGSFPATGISVDASMTSTAVGGLTNGQTYDFRVVTKTSSVSSYSSVVSATPKTVPGSPQTLVASAGNGQLSLTWAAPATTGGSDVTDYLVEYRDASTTTWTTLVDGDSTTTSAIIPGLTNGTTYEVRVSATNVIGTGTPSDVVTAKPWTVTGAPTGLAITAGAGQATLSWDAPMATGGSGVTGYVIEYRASTQTAWTVANDGFTGVSYAVTPLTNGTLYQFRVSAKNEAGTGPASAVVAATPATGPDAPMGLTPAIGDGSVTLTWTAPASDGGAAISDYVIEYKVSNDSTWTVVNDGVRTIPSASITSLINSTAYDFRVAAKNSVGTSAFTSSVSETPLARPSAPQTLVATYGNTTTKLDWTAPASNGGSPVTDYVIEYRAAATATWTTTNDGVGTGTSYDFTGLTNGTLYYFRVAATNVAGTGPASAPQSATPRTTPGSVGSLQAVQGNATASLTWAAPTSDGGAAISDYMIEYKVSNDSTWTVVNDGVGSGTSYTLTGLTNGTTYNVRVSAVNSEGSGPTSTTTASPRTAPDAPQPSAAPANGSVALSWTAPYNGGSAITSYTVQYQPSGAGSWTTVSPGPGAATTLTVASLANGTDYAFRVLATNVAGSSAYSASVLATPRTIPGQPTGLKAVHGNALVKLTWNAPAANGGSAISDYVIQYGEIDIQEPETVDGDWITFADGAGTSLSATVPGLTNGTTYLFQVIAVNAAGSGSASAPASDIPRTTPSEPVNLVASPDNGALDLTWNPPAYDGGQAIQDYLVGYRVSGTGAWTFVNDGVSTTTGARITGLVNGTAYDVLVEAHNGVEEDHVDTTPGVDGDDAIVTATPRTVPDAPTGLTANSANEALSLRWSAPTFNGGASVTDYVIEYRAKGASTWKTSNDGTSTSLSASLTGLANGTTYEVRVSAVNAAGTGATSELATGTPVAPPAPAANPQAAPSAPTRVEAITPPVIEPSKGGVILIDGVPSNVDLTPTDDAAGWLVQAPDFSLRFRPQASQRPFIELGPQRQMMVPQGGWVSVNGDGYQGGTRVSAYLIRRTVTARLDPVTAELRVRSGVESIYVGEAEVRADGTFSLRVEIDAALLAADYVLQVNGVSPEAKVRSVNMAVTVTEARTVTIRKGVVQRAAFFAPRSSKFTADGQRKLRGIAAAIPAGAQDVRVTVNAVSVSMDTLKGNMALARERAERILADLRRRGVTGTYAVSVTTQGDLRSRTQFLVEEPPTRNPLTRVLVTYSTSS